MVRSTEIYKNNNLDQWVRSVPSAEVVKAIRSLVNSVLCHFGPLKKDRSDRGPKWPGTEVDTYPCESSKVNTLTNTRKTYRAFSHRRAHDEFTLRNAENFNFRRRIFFSTKCSIQLTQNIDEYTAKTYQTKYNCQPISGSPKCQ